MVGGSILEFHETPRGSSGYYWKSLTVFQKIILSERTAVRVGFCIIPWFFLNENG